MSHQKSPAGENDAPLNSDLTQSKIVDVEVEDTPSTSQTVVTPPPDETSQSDGNTACKSVDHDKKSDEKSKKTSTEFYKGFPLCINKIIQKVGKDVLSTYHEKSSSSGNAKTRVCVKCLVCQEFEEEAKKFSANRRVYMASGIRCDGRKKLQDVVDHLKGAPHEAALKRKKLEQMWQSKSQSHPWIAALKATAKNPVVIKTLVEMAVDAIMIVNC